ncbi:hypothetical protein PCANC_24608 [Puccinia coronata f. sp. avenae]|uniref:F-box domain-containing protein n=1 Tax=Puccinia coronata f. sp. avenae TaxID=200324 RepID=A0A2N5TSZ1_9BASI|nr:hypothetical protein PCANC_24608 [Puccinia coronata f. sp. avenae]
MAWATLSDLPAELVIRIIQYAFYPDPGPLAPPPAHKPSQTWTRSHLDHDRLDHTELNGRKRKPRPYHQERIIPPPISLKAYQEPDSWKRPLPLKPLLWLCLINRTFRSCVQGLLFKNVNLQNTRTARMFLKALTCVPPHEDNKGPRKRQKRDKLPTRVSQYVQTLQFTWGSNRSPGKTSASLFCKILQNCPMLENIYISPKFVLSCKETIIEALASKPFIKDIVIYSITKRDNSIFQWQAHDVFSRLFSHWDVLETVDLMGLTSCASYSWNPPPDTFPVLNCAIRTMTLHNHNCDELTLSNLLKSCGASMRTLETTGPHLNLKPGAFGRVLRDSTSPDLECLVIRRPSHWQHTVNDLDLGEPDDIAIVLDIAFDSPTALRNLKTLTFYGEYMATDQLFARLPKSLVKLAWGQCKLTAPPFIDALTSSADEKGSLPNLMCCAVSTHRRWDAKDGMTVQQVLEKVRGGCFHPHHYRGYGSSSSTDSDP